MVSVPHLGQVDTLGCTIFVPHSGQNLVPASAIVLQLGHLAVAASCTLRAASVARSTAPPSPKAVANPFKAAPAWEPRDSAISSWRGLSSLQKPDCVSKSLRQTILSQVGHWRKCSCTCTQAASSCFSSIFKEYRGSSPTTLSATAPPTSGTLRSNPPNADLPISWVTALPTSGRLRNSRPQTSQ